MQVGRWRRWGGEVWLVGFARFVKVFGFVRLIRLVRFSRFVGGLGGGRAWVGVGEVQRRVKRRMRERGKREGDIAVG